MEGLGIDAKLMFAQGVNFLLFFYLFKRFLYKPFKKFVEKEQVAEKKQQMLLEELKHKEDEAEAKRKEILDQARSQAVGIVKEAEAEAAKRRVELIQQAKKEAQEIVKKGEHKLKEDRESIFHDARKHVVTVSAKLVREALKNYVNSSRQKEIISEITKNIKSS